MAPLRAGEEAAALAFLDRSPYENVFLTWAIGSPLRPFAGASLYLYKEGSSIAGVAFFGRHVVLAASSDAAIEAFAEQSRFHPNDTMIVGPRMLVEKYWQRVRAHHTPPRLVRRSQPLLAVDLAALKDATQHGVTVRVARTGEWKTVAINSAAMIAEELGYHPRSDSSDFDDSVRTAITRGTWWVGEVRNELCFFCNAGPRSEKTLQLQGIWTPPAMRRHGYATSALYQICDRLLQNVPTLSLYVNDFNQPALNLYARLGFSQVGEFSTLMF